MSRKPESQIPIAGSIGERRHCGFKSVERSGRPLQVYNGYYSDEHDSDEHGSDDSDVYSSDEIDSDGYSSDEIDPDDSVGNELPETALHYYQTLGHGVGPSGFFQDKICEIQRHMDFNGCFESLNLGQV